MTNSPSSPELGVPCQYRIGEELTLNALRRILQYSDADHQSIERARQYSEGDELTLLNALRRILQYSDADHQSIERARQYSEGDELTLNALRRILQYSDALKTDKPTI